MVEAVDTFLLVESYFLPDRLGLAVKLLPLLSKEEADSIISEHIDSLEREYGRRLDVDLPRFKKLMNSQEARRRFEACQNRLEVANDNVP